ncbi:heavy metal-associated isoprenylated plant protein 41-like protein [Tanacetum coccineum]
MAHLDYSPDSTMLFIGEGNFSYSMSICITLGAGANMTVTSYDTIKDLKEKYPDALANIRRLTDSGATVLHGVDARKIKHRELVRGFFLNVIPMLSPEGQCHVTHKRKPPFNQWHIPKLAAECGLGLTECADFNIKDYPGYDNKRGDGERADKRFPLGICCKYKFVREFDV